MALGHMWQRAVWATGAGLLLLVGGCKSFNENSGTYRELWERGQYQAAATKVTEAANGCIGNKQGAVRPMNEWNKDAIVYLLEQGAILRTTDQLEASNKAFERADRKMQAVWDRSEVVVSTEVMTVVNNQGDAPYDGYAYDHVMARTYMALNHLQSGNPLAARERLIAAEKAQRNYVEKRSRKIEEQKAQLLKEKPQARRTDFSQAKTADGRPASFTEVDALVAKYGAYENYRNPFSTWLYGLYMMAAPAASQDPGSAVTAMKLVAGMVPQNQTVQGDLAAAQAVAGGQSLPPTTYVIFETGLAPIRSELAFWLPIPTGRGQITPMKLAFPTLVMRDGYLPYMTVTADGTTYRTESLANMDGIVAREFKDELPLVITRTIVSGIVKAAATAGAAHGAGEYGAIAEIAGTIYQEATTRADLRQWATLPKEFQVCRMPTPANRTITLNLLSGPFPLKLGEGNVNLVYVKSINAQTPAIIWQAKLN